MKKVGLNLFLFTVLLVVILGPGCIHSTELPNAVLVPEKTVPIIITNATLFDGNPANGVKKGVNILISDGKIKKISKEIISSKCVISIDAKNKMVIPGLIDSHVHMDNAGNPPSFMSIGNPERNMSVFLYSGITTVVDMGYVLSDVNVMTEKIQKGEIQGPHFYSPGKVYYKEDGHPAALLREMLVWPISSLIISTGAYAYTNEEDLKENIKDSIESGAMFIKIMIDEIPLGIPNLNTEEVKSIVEAAKEQGLATAAHIGSESDLLTAVDAGVDILAHITNRSALSEDAINRVKKSGAVQITTLVVFENAYILRQEKLPFTDMDRSLMDPEILKAYEELNLDDINPGLVEYVDHINKYRNARFENVRKMKEAGIPIIAGTDAPNIATQASSALYKELELLVDHCGFTPMEAVAAATYVPGKQLLPKFTKDKRGHIKEGLTADLLILKEDFRKDIRNIQKIDTIIIDGRIVDRR